MTATMEDVEKSKKKRGMVSVRVREEEERERSQKLKLDQDGPTEEEVDQFFAILRRMKLALHHFHRKPNGASHWREMLEGTDVSFHDQRRHPPVKNNTADAPVTDERFDLNAVAPEAAEAYP